MNAIEIEGLTKAYRLYNSPRDRVRELLSLSGKKHHREFYALRDVSFSVGKGETLGIVGRNGSGKSTLLKIICGVVRPTEGCVGINGRISSLLELGAGFNPDFSGRENVYLNGALMGFSREEMDERFAEIAAFADIGEFIEQPVKLYSSGMYVRLAFATAINVDPDILVVDEALSVGDESFQRKCFSKIHQIQSGGSTVLFVSHNPSVILGSCSRAILLDHGKIILNGTPKTVVSTYQKLIYEPPKKLERPEDENSEAGPATNLSVAEEMANEREDRFPPSEYYDPSLVSSSAIYYESAGALIRSPKITTREGEVVNILLRGKEYLYVYDVLFTDDACAVKFGMQIKTVRGEELGGMVAHPPGNPLEFIEKGTVLRISFPFRCSLLRGVFFLNAGVLGMVNGTESYLHRCIDAAIFRVKPESNPSLKGMIDFSSDLSGNGVEISMEAAGDRSDHGVKQRK